MSKNIAYFFYYNAGSAQWKQGSTMPEICLGSLRKHNPTCDIRIVAANVSEADIKVMQEKYKAHVTVVDKNEIGDSMTAFKIKGLKGVPAEYGDNVLVLDMDLYFKEDPFKIFREDFDIFCTSRYCSHPFPVNGGVWGFRLNERSERFLDFYVDQICRNTTWQPLIEWRNEHKHIFGGWYVDQDFLCVLLLIDQLTKYGEIRIPWTKNGRLLDILSDEKIPIEGLHIMDAGPEYNYASSGGSGEKAVMEDYFKAIYFSDVKIVHLKHILHTNDWLEKLGLMRHLGLSFFVRYLYYGMRCMAGNLGRMVRARGRGSNVSSQEVR